MKRIVGALVLCFILIVTSHMGYQSVEAANNRIADQAEQDFINRFFSTYAAFLYSEAEYQQLRDFFVDEGRSEQNENIEFFLQKALLRKEIFCNTGTEVIHHTEDCILKDYDKLTRNYHVYYLRTYTDRWYPKIEQKEGTHYYIQLELIADNYCISNIWCNDPFDQEIKGKTVDWESLATKSEDKRERWVSDLFIGSEETEKSNEIPEVVGYYYLSTAAFVSYANTYAISYNPLFEAYDADCQDFASQCLWYGLGGNNTASSIAACAEPMVTAGINSRKWYRKKPLWQYDPNCNWITVESFDDCINASSSVTYGLQGTVSTGIASAQIGDIIQMDFDGDGWYTHSVVVVAVTGTSGSRTTSNIWISGHTTDMSSVCMNTVSCSAYRTIHINRFRYDTTLSG